MLWFVRLNICPCCTEYWLWNKCFFVLQGHQCKNKRCWCCFLMCTKGNAVTPGTLYQWHDSFKHKTSTRPDTIWLGNIPFALTLTMLSHALQIMGAMYYLCFKTFEGTEGCLLPQSKCEITKHVTTGSAEVRSNGSSSWQGGLNRMLDRLAMTNVNQNLSLCPIESDPSWTFQLLTPK